MKTPTIRIELNTSYFNLWLRLPDVMLQEILKLLRFFTKIQDFLKLKNLFSSISVFLLISNWKEMQSTWPYMQNYLGPQVVCLGHPLFIIRRRLRWTSFCKSEHFYSILHLYMRLKLYLESDSILKEFNSTDSLANAYRMLEFLVMIGLSLKEKLSRLEIMKSAHFKHKT